MEENKEFDNKKLKELIEKSKDLTISSKKSPTSISGR